MSQGGSADVSSMGAGAIEIGLDPCPGQIDLIVVSRSATLRQILGRSCECYGLQTRTARDAFDAEAILQLGLRVRQLVLVGRTGVSDARALRRRLSAHAGDDLPMVAIVDEPLQDLASLPSAPLEMLVNGIYGQVPPESRDAGVVDDAARARHLDACRELNRAQTLLLEVLQRVTDHNLPGPMMPKLLTQLRRKLSEPQLSLHDLADFVRPHQALSARVMQLANSPMYRRGEPTTSLRQALPRIGLKTTGALLQAVAMLEYEVGSDASTRTLIRRFLKESYLTALVAEKLATITQHPDPGEAYTVGLFHNIGPTFLFYTFALLFERGVVDNISKEALEQTAIESRARLNGVLVEALELPDALLRLDGAAMGMSDATEWLVLQALWVAERLLSSPTPSLEFDAEARMMGLDEGTLTALEPSVGRLLDSLAAFG